MQCHVLLGAKVIIILIIGIWAKILPVRLALFLMLHAIHYSHNYAGIIRQGLATML